MKTKKQIKKELYCSEVYTKEEFLKLNEEKLIIPYDGQGYFHDGENETNLSVWADSLTWDDVKDYPYIVWYNK